MNNQLYTQLSDLGFGEWLEKNEYYPDLKICDDYEVDALWRTQLNALAFRWLREEKKLECYIHQYYYKYTFDIRKFEYKGYYSVIIYTDRTYNAECYPTHPLTEHEALNKAVEIIKGGNHE